MNLEEVPLKIGDGHRAGAWHTKIFRHWLSNFANRAKGRKCHVISNPNRSDFLKCIGCITSYPLQSLYFQHMYLKQSQLVLNNRSMLNLFIAFRALLQVNRLYVTLSVVTVKLYHNFSLFHNPT